ncbi:hypothetical protein [Thermoproteus sp. CP80]|uniref:hypothetical protein n=1 Tax=Thermoproteus sp. CP80 TaxID=1650659 RepID=UPI00117CDB01|nr:hypothetical protein [Thermoproteus sp. CP80]
MRFSTTCSILPTPSGRVFTTTGTYKPLIRRALRLLRVEPSDDLVGLGIKYFEELYEYLKEEVGGGRRDRAVEVRDFNSYSGSRTRQGGEVRSSAQFREG